LLANTVMAWNTAQMQAASDRWANRRQVIPAELIGRFAPTRLEDINLRGIFRPYPPNATLQNYSVNSEPCWAMTYSGRPDFSPLFLTAIEPFVSLKVRPCGLTNIDATGESLSGC
jgi:hypothetical protein